MSTVTVTTAGHTLHVPYQTGVVRPPTGDRYQRIEDLGVGDDLQAACDRTPPGRTLVLQPRRYEVRDFTRGDGGRFRFGLWHRTLPGIWGYGATFAMTPRTSTAASAVPAQDTRSTNELYLIRMDAPGFTLEGLTIEGTDQGHLYNGVRFYKTHGGAGRDLTLKAAARGNWNSQPGETFTINVYACDGFTLERVDTDGRDNTGARVVASHVGVNSSSKVRIDDLHGHHSLAGMAVTFYRSTDCTTTRLRSYSTAVGGGRNLNGSGINHERCRGTFTHNAPEIILDGQWSGSATATANNACHFGVNSDESDHATLVHDPVFDPGPHRVFSVHTLATYAGVPQRVTRPARVWFDGREATMVDTGLGQRPPADSNRTHFAVYR